MPNSEPRIQCSNHLCVASNHLEANFCHVCKTPTTKRYLWAIREAISPEQTNQLIGDRYFALSSRIFLDTKPRLSPQIPEDIPPEIVTYLQLFPLYPHIPQVYGQLEGTDVWLLDYGTIPTSNTGKLISPIIPEITSLWQKATTLQQLIWLQQLAKLWQPLAEKQVASSLLVPQSIGVNGSFIQLLQLQSDGNRHLSLQDLGRSWRQWIKSCAPEIRDALEQLCERVEIGSIKTARQLVVALDRAVDLARRAYEYSYQIYSFTDAGPSRQKNQDAVFPTQGFLVNVDQSKQALAIVCDGVGGHEGGEIAARETIEHLRSRISELPLEDRNFTSAAIVEKLTKFINVTNDAISKRNDNEHRHERQRMGTTLVMSLARAHEIYLAHVGDSRIYWITPTSCHQLTVDDDLASREVRLGYAVYRDSLQYPSAGALIQAIGMRNSVALHPNIQRHFIDRDCVFLLCTDGLSDFDRVEQYWKKTILPVLQNKIDISSAVKTLIRIANERNGHDNATVALVHCRVRPKPNSSEVRISWSEIESGINDESIECSEITPEIEPLPDTKSVDASVTLETTVKATAKANSSQLLKSVALILTTIVAAVALFYLFLEVFYVDPNGSQTAPEDSETEVNENN
ncbi:PP2C family protein-serine/threonine phosphatase [Myxosarcina sp. GI1(2024)]